MWTEWGIDLSVDGYIKAVDYHAYDLFREEMRRYLFRNVACEAKKLSDQKKHMPDIPGWM